MTPKIACIVEGHGERAALPVLIRRIVAEIDPNQYVEVSPPARVTKSKLIMEGELERIVDAVVRNAGQRAAVLVLIDCDNDCPARDGPLLLRRARSIAAHVPIGVVLAKREFEAWFLAAATSLRGLRDIATDLVPPMDPEGISDAKGWISRHMPPGRSYQETVDQPALAAQFDLQSARSADSFDKLYREIERLLRELQP